MMMIGVGFPLGGPLCTEILNFQVRIGFSWLVKLVIAFLGESPNMSCGPHPSSYLYPYTPKREIYLRLGKNKIKWSELDLSIVVSCVGFDLSFSNLLPTFDLWWRNVDWMESGYLFLWPGQMHKRTVFFDHSSLIILIHHFPKFLSFQLVILCFAFCSMPCPLFLPVCIWFFWKSFFSSLLDVWGCGPRDQAPLLQGPNLCTTMCVKEICFGLIF